MTSIMRFDVTVSSDWRATLTRWSASTDATTATPFQSLSWLDAWYASFAAAGDVEPVLVDVSTDGVLVVRLPLIIRRQAGQRVLQFADLDLTDYNAPILGPAAPTSAADAALLWRSIVAALPPVDLIDFRKMPPSIDGRPNPIAQIPGTAACPLSGHLIAFASDWNTYHASLQRSVRMEFERSNRVLQRSRDAYFVRIRDTQAALAAIDFMDRQQRQRLEDLGQPFVLDQPPQAALYRHDLSARLDSGAVVVTALMAEDEMVAALYGVGDGKTLIVLRIANAGRAWSKVSPGRLIVHRTMEHMHACGFASVDLSIGDFAYKRRMNAVATPLVDFVMARSWKGRASELRHRAVTALRRYPLVDTKLRRVLGRRAA